MAESSPSKKTLAPAAVGIRLGSSTLTLAVSRLGDGFDARPAVIASDAGDRTTPAVVARANGEWVLGEAARQQAAKNQKNTFGNLLRLATATSTDPDTAKLLKGFTVVSDEASGTVT